MSKTVGIIGGVGPETTAEFYLAVVFGCSERMRHREHRPSILIASIPLPYGVEEDLLLRATGGERYISYLQGAARTLQKGGADFIVMPCNTLHLYIEEIREAVHVPVLSIVEETAKFLQRKGISRVGILATPMSLQGKLYETALAAAGIEQVVPDEFEQAKMGRMILSIVQNRHDNRDRLEIQKVVEGFARQGVENVILACTDLQLLIPQHPSLQIFDTMQIFADVVIERCFPSPEIILRPCESSYFDEGSEIGGNNIIF